MLALQSFILILVLIKDFVCWTKHCFQTEIIRKVHLKKKLVKYRGKYKNVCKPKWHFWFIMTMLFCSFKAKIFLFFPSNFLNNRFSHETLSLVFTWIKKTALIVAENIWFSSSLHTVIHHHTEHWTIYSWLTQIKVYSWKQYLLN